jgi:hypothetical protein
MFAVVQGHPNIAIVVFYVIACALLASTLYPFHKQT